MGIEQYVFWGVLWRRVHLLLQGHHHCPECDESTLALDVEFRGACPGASRFHMKSPTRLTSLPTSSAIRPPLKMPRIFDVWSVWEPEDFVVILLITPDRCGSCWC